MTELTILMPCLNEAATVARCVAKARGFLESAGVALVAGTAYGLSPYFRLSIATDIETLTDGVARIARAVFDLR